MNTIYSELQKINCKGKISYTKNAEGKITFIYSSWTS